MALAPLLLFLGAIPVTHPTLIAKCGGCHPSDEHGDMQRVSFARSTPEGWQIVLKRTLRTGRVTMTPAEARDVLKYLSDTHGLAPEESKPLLYEPERRIHDESNASSESLVTLCGKCHSVARALSWRRTTEDWKEFTSTHTARYHFQVTDQTLKALTDTAPLDSASWQAWHARPNLPELTGRWLLTAHVTGRGTFYGEMTVSAGAAAGEFVTHVTLRSIKDGAALERTGQAVVYAGHEWRGRSKGANPPAGPDDLQNDAREAMWLQPDGLKMEGRWFWGQYQEFGFDVTLERSSPSGTLLALDVSSLRLGTQVNRVRLLGDHFPEKLSAAQISAGEGVRVRRIVSASANEIVAEMDVDSRAVLGKRTVRVGNCELPSALAIYDRIDYIRVMPDSAMAAFSDENHPRGYQQFEAIAYQRGPDGKIHTGDDLALGPVDVQWSMEVFYETDPSQRAVVGNVTPNGFFAPAQKNAGANYDIWVVAAASPDLTAKSYVVVTVPSYVFEGRRYVRDLGRWVIEEP